MAENEKKGGALAKAGDFNPGMFLQSAIDKGLTPESLEKFMDLYDRWNASKAKKEFDAAMAAFQGECPVIQKGRKVDFESKRTGSRTQYSYAPLDQIVRQVGKIISKNDLSYTINATILKDKDGRPESVEATVNVTHVAGHTERSSFIAPLDPDAFMNAAQKFGSALTYAKRYAFCNAFGILTQDPDKDANDLKAGGPAVGGKAAPKYEDALKQIATEKDPAKLQEIRSRLAKGAKAKDYIFSPEQCEQLIRLIDGKAQELG